MREIFIARDFSSTPVGRYRTDGPHSGEIFREEFLREPILAREKVKVFLAGAAGYPSSFLEEAFGGLVRRGYADAKTLSTLLLVEPGGIEYERYRQAIWRYINRVPRA